MNQDQHSANQFNRNAPFNLAKLSSLNMLNNVHPRRPNKDGYLIGPGIDLDDIILLPQSVVPLFLTHDNIDTVDHLHEVYDDNETVFGLFTNPDSNPKD
ncbi:MAG: hypothetical protein ABFD51_07150, partial [Anaerolineaceae bacterium]